MLTLPSLPDIAAARRTIPIVEHLAAELDPADATRVERLAARLLAAEPALGATRVFGPRVSAGVDDGPALLFEDHSEIALFSGGGNANLQYRSLLLAGDGDLVVIGGQRSPDFEAYCRNVLALGAPAVASVARTPNAISPSLAKRCAANAETLGAICRLAREHGQLNLIPYIGTGHAWTLAGLIARRTGARVTVAAPPARLTRRVNDKLWFAARVQEVLGRAALPPSYHAFGLASLTGRLAALARRFERVVIKVPDSAGSAGNLVFDSASLRGEGLRSLRYRLIRQLRGLGWHSRFPLMVGVWDCAVLSSPSVQLWIPQREAGPPIVEGVFEQLVEGAEGSFVGAVPCRVPARLRERLAAEAMRLAVLLQRLGYFGRCSFDAVLAGERYGNAQVHWIECNGRWGGTSLPMTLANRLVGDWASRSLMIVQRTHLDNPARSLRSVLAALDPLLFRPGATESGVVLLTPGGIEHGNGLHFLLLGAREDDLRRQARALEREFGQAAGAQA